MRVSSLTRSPFSNQGQWSCLQNFLSLMVERLTPLEKLRFDLRVIISNSSKLPRPFLKAQKELTLSEVGCLLALLMLLACLGAWAQHSITFTLFALLNCYHQPTFSIFFLRLRSSLFLLLYDPRLLCFSLRLFNPPPNLLFNMRRNLALFLIAMIQRNPFPIKKYIQSKSLPTLTGWLGTKAWGARSRKQETTAEYIKSMLSNTGRTGNSSIGHARQTEKIVFPSSSRLEFTFRGVWGCGYEENTIL